MLIIELINFFTWFDCIHEPIIDLQGGGYCSSNKLVYDKSENFSNFFDCTTKGDCFKNTA